MDFSSFSGPFTKASKASKAPLPLRPNSKQRQLAGRVSSSTWLSFVIQIPMFSEYDWKYAEKTKLQLVREFPAGFSSSEKILLKYKWPVTNHY